MTKQFDNFADLITFTRASTGTFLDSDGLLKTATTNTPRIEFDINGNRKGILIEEARTNLILRSEEFDNSYWFKNGTSVTPNNEVAPDGTSSADKIVESSANSQHFLSATLSVSSGVAYTMSIHAKVGERSILQASPSAFWISNAYANFDLAQMTVTASSANVSAAIEDIGNGWRRCSATFTATSTASGGMAWFLQTSPTANRGDSYSGDGTSGIFVWGAQLEEGSFPTSYISTAGAAASRSADVASIPTSAFGYNADKGTVVCEFEVSNYVSGSRRLFSLNANFQNRMDGLLVNNGQLQLFVVDGGSTQVSSNTPNSVTNNEPSKAAAVYALNDFASVLDGGAIQTDTLGTVPSVSTLSIGNSPVNNWTNGHLKSIQYYPRRLTNAQIIRLTA